MGEHSKIGPSSLHRLLACPASFALSQGVPEGASSFYAAEGTTCHTIVESELTEDVFGISYDVGDTHIVDGHQITVDQDMLDGAEQMVTFCKSLMEDADKFWVEQRVDLGHLWNGSPPEPIFGTVDFGAYHKSVDTLYCVDLKYGRLSVVPHDNPQQNAYAVGMVEELGFVPKHIVNVIVQPRDMASPVPIKSAKITGLDLQIWAHDVLVPGVDAAFSKVPHMHPGEHCRFCPVKISCPALPVLAQKQAKADFSEVPVSAVKYTDEELGGVMDWVSVLRMWIDTVQAEASKRIEKGGLIPNWKLVPKRGIRKWDDEDAVRDVLTSDVFYTSKLKSPTQVEKMSPSLYKAVLDHVTKQSSGTTLAFDSDPRDAVAAKQAKDDFDKVE